MFILKILVGVLSLYASYKIAKIQAVKLKEVYYFWDSVCIACDMLINDLSYKKREVKAVLNVDYPSETFAYIMRDYLFGKEIVLPNFLSDENKIKVESFILSIGKSDSETQKNSIISYKNEFIKIKEESKIIFSKKYQITIKIGLLVGLMLFVMVM